MTTVGISTTGVTRATGASSTRWGGISGIAFGVILAVSTLMLAGKPQATNATKVDGWVLKHTGLIWVSVLLTMVAVVIGTCFLVWLHQQLTRSERGWQGTVFLAGAVIFATSGTVSAGLNAVLSMDAKHLSTGSLQLMASMSENVSYAMTCAGLAVMYVGAGLLIRRTNLLPGWLAWVSFVFAVLATSFFLGFVALLGSVLWLIVVGAIFATRQPVEN